MSNENTNPVVQNATTDTSQTFQRSDALQTAVEILKIAAEPTALAVVAKQAIKSGGEVISTGINAAKDIWLERNGKRNE